MTGEAAAALLAAGAGGLLVGWLLGTRRGREHFALRKRLEADMAQRIRVEEQLRSDLQASAQALARRESDLEHARASAEEKLRLLRSAEESLRTSFQSLSAEALRQNNQSFLDLARASLGEFQSVARGELEARQQAIGEMVAPVEATLQQVGSVLQSLEVKREGAYQALSSQIELMRSTQDRLRAETSQLVQALRSPSVRGQWGEIQLKRVIEMAGMLEHCDVVSQPTAEGDSGRLRPDYLVRLPGGKHLVLDAKAPLMAYLESLEASDETTRAARLRDHSRQVRDHLTKLGSKSYWEQFSPTPEFVVMFLPGETFFSAALQHDPSLIEFGVDQCVIPASPTTLIALLRAVFYGWQQERIAEGAEQVRTLGNELYDRLRVMAEGLDRLGRQLGQTVEAYNRTVGSFESRVLVSARRFKDLGAGTTRVLPPLRPVEASPRRVEDREEQPVLDGDTRP